MPNKTVYVRDERLWELLQARALSEGRSLSQELERAIRAHLKLTPEVKHPVHIVFE